MSWDFAESALTRFDVAMKHRFIQTTSFLLWTASLQVFITPLSPLVASPHFHICSMFVSVANTTLANLFSTTLFKPGIWIPPMPPSTLVSLSFRTTWAYLYLLFALLSVILSPFTHHSFISISPKMVGVEHLLSSPPPSIPSETSEVPFVSQNSYVLSFWLYPSPRLLVSPPSFFQFTLVFHLPYFP